ncbi:MAG: hypothetical protein N3A68_06915 [Bacteroidia bacterium]|jgi:hypothetical protein|nr:hypothetical protein [Bacteroidia bacterium]GIV23373.1 MAG: hypothetical protein KatS3mg025_1032 [Bacteroidia bacterium]
MSFLSERLIQWTLLRERSYLTNLLRPLGCSPKLVTFAEQYRTKHGVVDFILEDVESKKYIIVELEVAIRSVQQATFVITQVERYAKISLNPHYERDIVILYSDVSYPKLIEKIRLHFTKLRNIKLVEYSYDKVILMYHKQVEELERHVGLILEPSKAMDITHLRWLNRITNIFRVYDRDYLVKTTFWRLHPRPEGFRL